MKESSRKILAYWKSFKKAEQKLVSYSNNSKNQKKYQKGKQSFWKEEQIEYKNEILKSKMNNQPSNLNIKYLSFKLKSMRQYLENLAIKNSGNYC